MKKFICRLVSVCLAVLLTCLFSACTVDGNSNPDTYDFGKDEVPSITSVVGERELKSEEKEGKNEFPSKEYTYTSDSVSDDLLQYTQLLQEQGWTAAGDGYDLKQFPGSAQFVKESVDEGQILTIYISFEENEYSIKVTKVEAVIAQ